MSIAIGIGIFLSIILFVEGGYYCYHQYISPQNKTVKRRLRGGAARPQDGGKGNETLQLLRQKKFSDLAWLNTILNSLPSVGTVETLLQQANSKIPLGRFFLISGVLGGAALLGCALMNYGLPLAIGAGVVCTFLPLLWMKRKRKKRFAFFEAQLPEALDLMARALRAGHAFSIGMKMVGDEFPDPIGPEFSRTVEEISFGIDTPEAMENLNNRVESTDLKFFITALIVQRETGGNLAEIIEAISLLIRQRFELLGRIKALSAEGRMSGYILFAMPIVVAGILFWLNEPYMRILIDDQTGQMITAVAGVLMCIGAYVMKNMCDIKI